METLHADIAVGLRSFTLNVALDVERERIALVGPSGAGKTTVLRAIAGLAEPDEGRIAFGSQVWFDRARRVSLAPEQRSVGLVFQEYALFPHLTVKQNVAFGGNHRTDELLSRFGIEHLASERPGAISGGERQRVALARALSRDPAVLLLDEPLSALDAQTRSVIRGELQVLLTELELPTLMVTHDFRDAAALADRIGVIIDGQLRQLGTAAQLTDAPADSFVARFAGANVLSGHATPTATGGATVQLDEGAVITTMQPASGSVDIAIYPWNIRLSQTLPNDSSVNAVPGRIASVAPEAGRLRVRLGRLDVDLPARQDLSRGEHLYGIFAPADTLVLGSGVTDFQRDQSGERLASE